MDIVESIERYIAGTDLTPGTRTRLVRARDEIVRLRRSQLTPEPAQQEPVAFIDMSQWPPIRWRDGMIRSDVAAFDGQPLVICGHRPQAREPEQPAQGCDFCNNPLYAGTVCKNCGRQAVVDFLTASRSAAGLQWIE
jgi:hypothetical protein